MKKKMKKKKKPLIIVGLFINAGGGSLKGYPLKVILLYLFDRVEEENLKLLASQCFGTLMGKD